MEKVLLTGSSGFLGQNIIKCLFNYAIETLGRSNATIIADLVYNIPLIDSVDIVIHAAGKAHLVPKTAQQAKDFYNVNVQGTINLLKCLEKPRQLPKSFIFISSVAVYGLECGKLIKEDAPLLATDPYGKSKVEAEKIIQDWCLKNNVKCTILRLPLIAGTNPPGNLKAMINGITKGYYFNIAGGKAKKSIVLAEDVAKIIPIAANIGGIYNLTDQYHPSFFELSKVIAQQLGKSQPMNIPMWIAILMAKVGDLIGSKAPINSYKLSKIISDLTFDGSKAQKSLGWKPNQVLKEFKIR
jgi:nucleoside-diphosphate-sugar epimerase